MRTVTSLLEVARIADCGGVLCISHGQQNRLTMAYILHGCASSITQLDAGVWLSSGLPWPDEIASIMGI